MAPVSVKENLKREIGVWSLTLAIINQTIGTGIFVIPALIAVNLGAAAVITYFVCGILIFLIALCFAELGSKTTASGGVYEYIETAFGPYTGFLANNIYWFGASVISDAAIANALADTLKYFFPSLSNELFRIGFFFIIFGGIALLNIRSVKNGIRFIEFTAFGKLIPLLVLVIVGASFIVSENLYWTINPTTSNIGSASLLLFFAFMGFETPLSNGGEMKNPKKTVPLGIFLGIASVLIIYLAIQLVTQGVLGGTIEAHQDAPLAAVAGIVFGKSGIVLITATTSISMLGALGGEILSVPRILFAGARDGLMPKVLSKIHPRFSTPYIAVLFYASLGLLFAIFGAFKQLAIIASASSLIIYLGVILATLKLRKTDSLISAKTFIVPGGIIIPMLAICVIVWLLSNLSKQELIGVIVFIIVFSLIYSITKISKKKNDLYRHHS
ncbi:APC family permease [Salmonirosea aquatica]|uniref:Amino acid permease n=1 Tax=Salmonirosea aquatica TaxID=2654236 RepID=A0A7C9BT64_9BACT|nr:amino acid permease [Cytophagaceae bacterium SJW1-29]